MNVPSAAPDSVADLAVGSGMSQSLSVPVNWGARGEELPVKASIAMALVAWRLRSCPGRGTGCWRPCSAECCPVPAQALLGRAEIVVRIERTEDLVLCDEIEKRATMRRNRWLTAEAS